MTADEYKELYEKLKKYESYDNTLQSLIRFSEFLKPGISLIRSIGGTTYEDVFCGDTVFGDGFQELVTQKVIEAFDEQISRIEKQLEGL